MSARKFSNLFLPRFRNQDDALEFMDCVRSHKNVPPEIWVWPFVKIGDSVVINPEYQDAPFECQYLL